MATRSQCSTQRETRTASGPRLATQCSLCMVWVALDLTGLWQSRRRTFQCHTNSVWWVSMSGSATTLEPNTLKSTIRTQLMTRNFGWLTGRNLAQSTRLPWLAKSEDAMETRKLPWLVTLRVLHSSSQVSDWYQTGTTKTWRWQRCWDLALSQIRFTLRVHTLKKTGSSWKTMISMSSTVAKIGKPRRPLSIAMPISHFKILLQWLDLLRTTQYRLALPTLRPH